MIIVHVSFVFSCQGHGLYYIVYTVIQYSCIVLYSIPIILKIQKCAFGTISRGPILVITWYFVIMPIPVQHTCECLGKDNLDPIRAMEYFISAQMSTLPPSFAQKFILIAWSFQLLLKKITEWAKFNHNTSPNGDKYPKLNAFHVESKIILSL